MIHNKPVKNLPKITFQPWLVTGLLAPRAFSIMHKNQKDENHGLTETMGSLRTKFK